MTARAALDARIVVARDGFRLDVDLAAAPGEVVAVMGPSGAGKSTLLGVLAGLVDLDEGHVRLGARTLDEVPVRPGTGHRTRTTPSRRGIVLLGQEPRLFPHLTAQRNIAFGLRAHGASRADASARALEWLARVGLGAFADRRPTELSGGQQQRVALARALATNPDALLLDEPLTSLDAETAGDIRALLHDQLAATGTTAIVATHDAVDAVALADRLVVLEDGRVTQAGPVREVLAEPATRFTAAVAGLNRVAGEAGGDGWRRGPLALPLARTSPEHATPRSLAAVFRPGDVKILPHAPQGAGEWSARVVRLEQTPAGVRVRTAEPDVAVDVVADRAAGIRVGEMLALRLDPADVRFVVDRHDGERGGGLS